MSARRSGGEELAALKAGRKRHQRRAKAQRRRDAVRRVRDYRRWLKNGSPMRKIPAIPTSAEFRLAAQQQERRR